MSDDNQGLPPSLPSGDFLDEGDVVFFRDAIHHKYVIKIPKQYVVLLSIEGRTRWRRFRFDTVDSFGAMDL